jgi:hypothetical protein
VLAQIDQKWRSALINTAYDLSGDPTDTSIKLRPLEPASGQALARDLVLKTRRRKGLGDQIAVSKYLDDEFVVSLARRCNVSPQCSDDIVCVACSVCFWSCRSTRMRMSARR